MAVITRRWWRGGAASGALGSGSAGIGTSQLWLVIGYARVVALTIVHGKGVVTDSTLNCCPINSTKLRLLQ